MKQICYGTDLKKNTGSFSGHSRVVLPIVSSAEKHAFERGGPVWPPRSNATDDCLGLPPQLNIWDSGGQRPPTKIRKKKHGTWLKQSFSNSFNAKTLVVLVEKNCKIDLLQINLGTTNSSLSQSTYFCLENNSVVNHGVVSYGKNKSHLMNSLNVIQQPNSY